MITDVTPIHTPSMIKGNLINILDAPINCKVFMSSFLEKTDSFIVLKIIKAAMIEVNNAIYGTISAPRL